MLMNPVKLAAEIACAAGMIGSAAAQTPPPNVAVVPPVLQNVHRIVMLGDSITQIGDGPGGYVWLTRQYLQSLYPSQGIEVINAGISGNKSNDMLGRYQTDVLDRKPDLITISVGVNDVWHGFYDNHPLGDGPRGIKLEDYRRNVESMVDQALKQAAKVVILSATPIEENQDGAENRKAVAYNAALRDIAHRRGLIYVDYQRPFWDLIRMYRRDTGGHDNFLTVDGVHMNSAGNEVMAHVLLTSIRIPPEVQAIATKQVQADMRRR
jgi:lysophospholipase L1-like esterase